MIGSAANASTVMTTGWVLAWTPAIGDPTLLGWTITLAYAIATWMALRAAAVAMRARATGSPRNGRHDSRQREYLVRFWCFVACVVAVLCVNKQLDLQTLFTESAREIAKSGGWYRERKSVQVTLLAVLFGLSVLLALWMLWILRPSLQRVWMAICGLVVLAAYVAMRGTSHHAVDQVLSAGPVPLRNSLELIGIALIVWPAWRLRA